MLLIKDVYRYKGLFEPAMSFLRRILIVIGRVSSRFPLTIVGLFLGLSVAGFAVVPWINSSTNLITGVGDNVPVIKLTQSNYELFGEQDSLIIVLEFAEPPGDVRLPLSKLWEKL